MNVIILAAGRGTRFDSKDPKCLSMVDNQSIISRIISQINNYIPDANIKLIVGYKSEIIKNHTSKFDLSYIFNDKFMEDKNIWSVFLGIENSKNGVLIIEGDCVYDNQSFLEISKSLGKESVVFLGDQADQKKLNGVIKVKNGYFDDFFIGRKNSLMNKNHFNMSGAFWISKKDILSFRKEIFSLSAKNLDFYYFIPLFNKNKFKLKCKQLSGKRYTFNTQAEYNHMLKNFVFMDYFEVSKLKHIEGFSRRRVNWLKDKILDEKIWTKPVCIDPDGLVMDGQHRMEVSKELGLKKIPVVIFDYNSVEIYSLRKNHKVTVELIKQKVKQNDLYPYKTVKHKFPVEIKNCIISLNNLYEN
ncbi:MAG: NTP transferase domain-containing protein [Patescibacteria group bacterium]